MKKISLRLAAIGTAAVLAATSLAVNQKPANAGNKRIKASKILMHNGLTPIDDCTVSSVSVVVESEQVCAMPNYALGIGPGTYRVHPDTLTLIPYGITARINGSPNQTPTNSHNPSQIPNQTPVNINNSPQVINAVNQSSSSFSANGSIYSLSGQQISPPILAMLRSLLAGNNIAEAACGATLQQVTITVNNEFVICGYPNNRYTPGNYSFTLNGLY